MNFTDLLKRKIEERREGRSEIVQATMDADARFRRRSAPLAVALTAMIETLAADPMFANAMGRPDIIAKRNDRAGREGSLRFDGRAGLVMIGVSAEGDLNMRVNPTWVVANALDCGMSYGAEPVRGHLSGIDDFVERACEHLGDYLADIYLSPAAHLLQPEPGTPVV